MTLRTALALSAALGAGAPALAATVDHTCTGLRHCQNFASACQAAGGKHSVDVPSTPGGGPIVNHCKVDEGRMAGIGGLSAAPGAPALSLAGR